MAGALDIGSIFVKIGLKDDGFARGMKGAKSSMQEVGAAASQLGGLMSAAITAPMIGFSIAAGRAGVQMDSLKRGLTAVTGSSAETEVQLKRLKEIAKLPGLGMAEAVQGSINLQAAGMSAALAESALTGFGNALATVGKGKADLEGVQMALSQIMSKGVISAEEINQLAERVPQIRKIMESAFGTSNTEALQKMGISSEQFVRKITVELNKLPKVAGGAQNAWENMTDAMQSALVSMWPTIEPIFTRLTDWVSKAAEWFEKLPGPVKGFGLALGGIAALGAPFLLFAGQLIQTFVAIKAAMTAQQIAAVKMWAATLGPIGLAAAGLTALGIAAWTVVKAQKSVTEQGLENAKLHQRNAEKTKALADQYEALRTKTNKTVLEQETMNSLLGQIQTLAPEFVKGGRLIEGALDGIAKKAVASGEATRKWLIWDTERLMAEAQAEVKKVQGLQKWWANLGIKSDAPIMMNWEGRELKGLADIEGYKAKLAELRNPKNDVPGADNETAAKAAAADAQAAADIRYDIEKRNASRLEALEMERKKAYDAAAGPLEKAAINDDYADRKAALEKDLQDDLIAQQNEAVQKAQEAEERRLNGLMDSAKREKQILEQRLRDAQDLRDKDIEGMRMAVNDVLGELDRLEDEQKSKYEKMAQAGPAGMEAVVKGVKMFDKKPLTVGNLPGGDALRGMFGRLAATRDAEAEAKREAERRIFGQVSAMPSELDSYANRMQGAPGSLAGATDAALASAQAGSLIRQMKELTAEIKRLNSPLPQS